MFTLSNTRKVGDLSFTTAKGKPVNLRPLKTLNFEDDELNDGLLRTMIGQRSFYKVLADSAEAQEMIDKASVRKPKKNGSPLVHGSTEPFRGPERVIEVRDLKGAGGDNDQKEKPVEPKQHPLAPAPAPVTPGVFIREEKTDETPLQKLIAVAADKPYTELVTEARVVMGDKFPEGRPGRPAIIKALNEMEAALKPQE